MDLLKFITGQIQTRQGRTIAVAAVLLLIVAALQINQLHLNPVMRPLIDASQLRSGDAQRMQLALSQAGMSGFAMRNGELVVPANQHSRYLKAVADSDAVPAILNNGDQSAPAISPFLSRWQQQLVIDNDKKKQVREMVTRLPFVQQAWFEMDTARSSSAFTAAKQSAVLSVQPPAGVRLDMQQVATLRQMIGGALANIDPAEIAVIDISHGTAHHDSTNSSNAIAPLAARSASEQEIYYRNQICQALSKYKNVEIDVRVTKLPSQAPVAKTASFERSVDQLRVGTNSVASIDDAFGDPRGNRAKQVSHNQPQSARVEVELSVPASMVPARGLKNSPFTKPAEKPEVAREKQLEMLRRKLVEKVRPLLPESSFASREAFPITVNVVEETPASITPWHQQFRSVARQHWPSALVLIVGLFLLGMMNRRPTTDGTPHRESPDVLSIGSVEERRNAA